MEEIDILSERFLEMKKKKFGKRYSSYYEACAMIQSALEDYVKSINKIDVLLDSLWFLVKEGNKQKIDDVLSTLTIESKDNVLLSLLVRARLLKLQSGVVYDIPTKEVK